jgi:hypothetical protein
MLDEIIDILGFSFFLVSIFVFITLTLMFCALLG